MFLCFQILLPKGINLQSNSVVIFLTQETLTREKQNLEAHKTNTTNTKTDWCKTIHLETSGCNKSEEQRLHKDFLQAKAKSVRIISSNSTKIFVLRTRDHNSHNLESWPGK